MTANTGSARPLDSITRITPIRCVSSQSAKSDAVRPESPFGRVFYSRSIKERLAVVLEVLA